MTQSFYEMAVIVVMITASLLILIKDWRIRIGVLAIQYLGVFLLTLQSWPLGLAVTKPIAGWMAGAVLGMALIALPDDATSPEKRFFGFRKFFLKLGKVILDPEKIFYFLCVALVILVVSSLVPATPVDLFAFSNEQLLGSLFLIGLGLLALCLYADILSTMLGILTIASGIEVMYATQEFSILVAGLLSVVTLGIALVGAYLLLAPQMEEEG